MQKSFDAVVVGNAGIDTNIYNYGNDINFDVEANFTENIDYIGQAGGYASRGFAKLGYKTAFIGYVGDDFSGKFIRETFNQDGIDTSGIFIDPAGTSRSVNFMFTDGRRKNFYDGKSHMELKPDSEICKSILKKSQLAHFNIPNWARQLLPIAKELGITISCDLQDITDIHDPYRQDFIKYADILFFSAVNFDLPEHIFSEIINKYPNKILIAGMGKTGCALATNKGIQYFEAIELPEKVIDTNGAGDGLAVGFLTAYLLEKRTFEESILCGQIAARYTYTQKANTSNLISAKFLQQYFEKLKK